MNYVDAALHDPITAFEVSWRLCLASRDAIMSTRGTAPHRVESAPQLRILEGADVRYNRGSGPRVVVDTHHLPTLCPEDSPDATCSTTHLQQSTHLFK